MKKSKLVLALAAATMIPGVAFSAAPIAFNSGWALNGDGVTVDHTCAAGYVCDSAPISDDNFLQVQMTDTATGTIYYRTIIATGGAGEVFENESFVVSGTGSATGGIAAKQTLNSSSVNSGTMTSTTELMIGDFNAGESQVNLVQDIWDGTSTTTSEFHSGFGFTKDAAGLTGATTLDQQIAQADGSFTDRFDYSQSKNLTTDTVISTSMDIVSGVVINTPGGTVDDQSFNYSLREGAATAGAGSAALGAGTTSWVAGDKVSHVLVGQQVALAGDFGYERVSNEQNPLAIVENNEFSLSGIPPAGTFVTWTNDPFGALASPTTTTVVAAPAVP